MLDEGIAPTLSHGCDMLVYGQLSRPPFLSGRLGNTKEAHQLVQGELSAPLAESLPHGVKRQNIGSR